MNSWKQFEEIKPNLANFGKERFSKGVAYLGTIQKDGSPRVHPITPIISPENLFVFMEPTSPKGKDLIRKNKFFIHSLVTQSSGQEGEFWVKGAAKLVNDANLRKEAILSSSYEPANRYILFQLFLEEVGSTTYQNGNPSYQRWKSA